MCKLYVKLQNSKGFMGKIKELDNKMYLPEDSKKLRKIFNFFKSKLLFLATILLNGPDKS